MNCFNHREAPAVGLCKSCGKALCGACVTELVNGLVCKGACETRVNLINRMLDSNVKIMNVARHQVRTGGILNVLMGIGCAVFAVWAYFTLGGFLPYFIGLLAAFTLAMGLFRLSRKERYPHLEEPGKPSGQS